MRLVQKLGQVRVDILVMEHVAGVTLSDKLAVGPLREKEITRLGAQRPDNFLENLRLVYGVPVGTLERDWRAWLRQVVEEAGKGEGRVREGPLIKDRN